MFGILTIAASFLCLSAVAFYGCAMVSARAHFFRRPAADPGFHPPVSILKPILGLDEDTYENLASFCRQDYPDYEIIFSVKEEGDPCVETVRRLVRDFPEREIRLVVKSRVVGSNPKVSNLANIESEARHPVILLCDSDIRVGPDYLRRVVQPLRDPAVGAVTCMCRSLSKGFVGTLEALRESTEFCPSVLVASQLEGIRFALGSTIVLRRAVLEEIGGFTSVADYLSDDFQLGSLIAKAGYQVVLSEVVVEHALSMSRVVPLFRRQIRWNRGIHTSRPWGYRGLIFTYGIPASLLLLAAGGATTPWGWGLAAATWGARLTMAYVVGVSFLEDRAAARFLWLVPVQDILSFTFWGIGFLGHTVYWRDRAFRLTRSGKLVPDHEPVSVANQ